MGKCLPLAGRYANGEVFAVLQEVSQWGSVCHLAVRYVNGEVFAIWQKHTTERPDRILTVHACSGEARF